jgi:ABC-type methionine transport system ATPase subunit
LRSEGEIPWRPTAGVASVPGRLEAFRLHDRVGGGRREELQQLQGGALAVVGLAERMQKPASGLTAADRVRVLIARALAHAPRRLLIRDLDRALPPDDVQPMLSLLRSFTRGDRRSVIVTLAEPPVAARLADRFLFLSAGRLVHDADCAPARNVGVERNLQLVRT